MAKTNKYGIVIGRSPTLRDLFEKSFLIKRIENVT